MVAEVYMHLIAQDIERRRVNSTAELDLQDAVEEVLRSRGTSFHRERRLDAASRIDFLTREGLGIEVKVKGSRPALLRQLHRYAQHDAVHALLVVTTRAKLSSLPEAIGGKPVGVASLLSGAL